MEILEYYLSKYSYFYPIEIINLYEIVHLYDPEVGELYWLSRNNLEVKSEYFGKE
jgi:hypothetical protein